MKHIGFRHIVKDSVIKDELPVAQRWKFK